MIVALDEETIARLPHPPPYPRTDYARLIDLLHAGGARLIAFDIAFDRPQARSADEDLRRAARRAAPVLFGTAEIGVNGRTLVLGGAAGRRLARARVGATLLPSDADGVLRRLPQSIKGLPTLPVVAAELLGAPAERAALSGEGALIDYAGQAGRFSTVSLAAVLEGHFRPGLFAGKTVLVGATARALQDIHTTPFGEMPGVEIQANALATVLAGVPLRRVAGWSTILFTLLLACVAPLASLRLRPVWAIALSVLAAVAYLVVSQLAFDDGHVLDVTAPILGSILSLGGMLGLGLVTADREQQRLRAQFAAYSTELVDAVLAGDTTVALDATHVIGGYELLEVVGRGGMAVVYRATQLALERQVAVKLIAPEFARSPMFRERFLRESRLAAAVEHPNVVPVYEAGEDSGLLYIAMRYVDGIGLDDLIERLGPLAPADAVRVVTQLADGLDAAHARGLVHRDVKPSNVLLETDLSHAYLTDFGIARAAGEISALTSAGTFLGTPDYAAPEQIAGAEIDGRADVYALGGLLFHALTGRVPFEREELLAKLAAHMDAAPPRVSSVVPALAAFDMVIVHAMAKSPAERPQTARELADQAGAALHEVSPN
jgi:CHASE2 domain-containing sensor protein/tRNA A-37 threonylcarbamoyl transferase component Bud32